MPTAITTRPQLASSPATAVFTSGELAIDMAMRCAEASLSAPVTRTVTNLRAPSPSLATSWASSISRPSSASRKPASRASAGSVTAGLPALAVANSISVSEVEVSPSTVTQLKLVFVPADRSACSTS